MDLNCNKGFRLTINEKLFHSEASRAVEQAAQTGCSSFTIEGFQDPTDKPLILA